MLLSPIIRSSARYYAGDAEYVNPYCIASAIVADSKSKVKGEDENDTDSQFCLDEFVEIAAKKWEKQVRYIEERDCSPEWRMPFEMVMHPNYIPNYVMNFFLLSLLFRASKSSRLHQRTQKHAYLTFPTIKIKIRLKDTFWRRGS